jgi:flagellar protein FlaG
MKVELYKNIALDQINLGVETKPQKVNPPEKQVQAESSFSQKKINKERLNELTEHFQKFLNQFNLEAKLVYERDYDTFVVQVLRKDTGDLIRQIPPQELLELSKRLQELVGILFKEKV